MPQNRAQKMIFALLTVIITVHAYVFYSLYVVNGAALTSATGQGGVLAAVQTMGGVMVLGRMVPVWAVVLIEFCLAYLLEVTVGSPMSFKIACSMFDPAEVNPAIFEVAIICATVAIMCPAMSFLAAILYYPYYAGFNLVTFIAKWLKLVCFNCPFALITQIFFIQPAVRRIFGLLFRKNQVLAEQGE